MPQLRYADVKVGDTLPALVKPPVNRVQLALYAGASGDHNPIHLDEDYAKATPFNGRIAHGMLSASFISTIFGTMMPGRGSIYLSQNLRFKAPVRHGDLVRAVVEVADVIAEKKRVLFKTQCFVGNVMVIDGDATIMVPSRAA